MERLLNLLEQERIKRENQALIRKAGKNLEKLFRAGEEKPIPSYISNLIKIYDGQVVDKGIRSLPVGENPITISLFQAKRHKTFYVDYSGVTAVFTLDNWSGNLSTLAVHTPAQENFSTQDPKIIKETSERILDLYLSPQVADAPYHKGVIFLGKT